MWRLPDERPQCRPVRKPIGTGTRKSLLRAVSTRVAPTASAWRKSQQGFGIQKHRIAQVIPPCNGANSWERILVGTRGPMCRSGQGQRERPLSRGRLQSAPMRKTPRSEQKPPQHKRRTAVPRGTQPTGTAHGHRLRAPPTGKPSFDVIGGVRARPERSRRDDRRPTACRQRLLLQARMSSTAA
jgi:hypothetical protein